MRATQPVGEELVQRIWRDHLFVDKPLRTEDGRRLKVLSSGWWNRGEGPDFIGAQLEIGGKLKRGDVEVHLDHGGWRQHGHDTDPRYDEVILEVVLADKAGGLSSETASGRRVPCLLLGDFLRGNVQELAERFASAEAEEAEALPVGQCAAFAEAYGAERVLPVLVLAGEWRVQTKARLLAERMERAGADQAIYEAFLTACGYARFKYEFRAVAQQLPYDRVRQLARQEGPLLVEAALLQLAGLLPEALPETAGSVAHFERLRALKAAKLPGLGTLPFQWRKPGVRPNNAPERRLAGAARFLARTAKMGLAESLERIWHEDLSAVARRRQFESLFPGGAAGFWCSHCVWTGRKLRQPTAPLGAGRVRSIIGNVFVTAGLAVARRNRDRRREERVLEFYARLPKEPGNRVVDAMLPRVFGDVRPKKRLNFRSQQGLIQIYQDWCEHNPSCRNCAVIPFLDTGYGPGNGDF